MSQAVLRVEWLPADALEAAAEFHARRLGKVNGILAGDCASLIVVLPGAPYDHSDWRRALAKDLGRAAAPKRVNVIAGEGEAVEHALAYLAVAPGVTGQFLQLDGQGASNPAGS